MRCYLHLSPILPTSSGTKRSDLTETINPPHFRKTIASKPPARTDGTLRETGLVVMGNQNAKAAGESIVSPRKAATQSAPGFSIPGIIVNFESKYSLVGSIKILELNQIFGLDQNI
jgi:hypothetical protein